MKPHPIIDYPFRWIPMLVLALILVATQVALVCGYTGNDYLPALVDGVATIGWLAAIAYLAWSVVLLVVRSQLADVQPILYPVPDSVLLP